MSTLAIIAIVIAFVFLIRERLRSLPITPPMLFVLAGMVLAPEAFGLVDLDLDDEAIAFTAEVTLALLLFSDAGRIDLGRGARELELPARLLGIGLPLTIAMGTLVAAMLLADLSWAEAALVAAILAPTDAALGEAVVSNTAVPVRVRQALNVESGLNDGLVVPVIAVFSALAAESELDGADSVVAEAFAEIGIALAVGIFVAWLLSVIVPFAEKHKLTDAEGFRVVALAAGFAAFVGSIALGGNGFVAAFVCGLVARRLIGASVTKHTELAEDVSQVGAAVVFFIFGAVMVWPALDHVTFLIIVCAVGTLTIGRMIPVAVALIGTHLQRPTVAFLGWFGPRGLASLLFGLLLLTDNEVDEPDELFAIITVVVLASVFLHGLTATPGAERYATWFDDMSEHDDDDMMESEPVTESKIRGRPTTN